MLRPEPFDTYGFLLYVITLGLFCLVTIGDRGGKTFYLAQFGRDLVGVDTHFMRRSQPSARLSFGRHSLY